MRSSLHAFAVGLILSSLFASSWEADLFLFGAGVAFLMLAGVLKRL